MKTVAIVEMHAEPSRLLEIAQKLCDFKEIKGGSHDNDGDMD